MLFDEHSGGERVRVVVGENGDSGLSDDGASVQGRIHQVDRAPVHVIPRGEGPLVRVQAGVLR